MTTSDPLAEVRAEFAAGLGERLEMMRTALGRLRHEFRAADAQTLYRAAHALTGTAGSLGAEGLAQAAGDLEGLVRKWLERDGALAEEWRVAAAAVAELEGAAREYGATVRTGELRTPAARLAVLGELTSLINAAVDMREIFRGAILKVQRVLDFRRASVVLIDETATCYALHTLYDAARGGFLPGQAIFPITQGLTGEAIRTGRPLRVDALPGTEGILLQEGKHASTMIVPLRVGDRVIGTLNFGHEEPGHYTDEDLDWAVVLGRQIETSLYYAKLLSTIAEQREALAREHRAVQHQRNQLEALIDASDAAIMLVDSGRKVGHANNAMARLVGITRDALLGAPLDTIHRFLARSFKEAAALAAQERALAGDTPLRDEVEFGFPQPAVCRRIVAPVREAGGALLGHIVLYRDVTREVEADRMKSEFVSVVSHELRTPMTSVQASLSLLLAGAEGPLPPRARELLEIAVRNGDRLIRLVNDLLDLSRIEAGRLDLELEPVALGAAIRSSVEAVAAFASEQAVAVDAEPPDEPLYVLGARDRVEQVVVNLLANAIKFSPRGGRVRVTWRRDGGTAVTEVADQGPGIPGDKLTAIFEPFRQLDSSATREHGGAGLGLAISQGIVKALEGALWAESDPGEGSRFFVRLPLASAPPEAGEPSLAPQAERRSGTVLVAHSDEDWQRLAATRVAAEGWRLVSARTGGEALARLGEAPANLVVVAQELADMHGLELLQQLRADPRFFDIPALMVTEGDASRSLEYGAEAWTAADPLLMIEAAKRLLAAPQRRVVLLVENDPALRRSLWKVLRRAGFACLATGDAVQGLAFARQRRPDAVITDYQMPGMDGLTFLRELRADAALKAVPALMLTGHLTRDLARQAAEVAASALAKPVETKELVEAIEKLASGNRE